MMTYLEDGRCSFCNNLSEIEVKPIALGAFEKYLPWNPEVKTALEEKAQKLLKD